ncbi:MAG: hypothetical protein JG776_2372 [Caloramator sp.]|uniref:hypothetical protein n=1 Tax=Caloramator sp. TaxID=1871330 RepID=UPI001D1EB4FA|nr:hypothetical protein [Caloramator sp.]MBZ4664648.1 hypothetical protein [Caloramator sp.]
MIINEETIPDIRELYILGLPIKTKIGNIHFAKVKDYYTVLTFLPYIFLTKEDIYELFEDKKMAEEQLKDIPFLIIIKNIPDLYLIYKKIFYFFFKEDVFDLVETDDELNYYLNLMKTMNCLHYEKPSKDPEIAKFDMYDRIYKEKRGLIVTFEAMVTSVELISRQNALDMTIYKLNALFNRIMAFENYRTSVLFATVAPDVQIENWFKHIDVNYNNKNNKTFLKDYIKEMEKIFNN